MEATDDSSESQPPAALESTLVRHYLDLDEAKDEAYFIQHTDSVISPHACNSSANGEANVLDDYLNSLCDPFSFELKRETLKSTRMPIITRYEEFLLTVSQANVASNEIAESYASQEAFKAVFCDSEKRSSRLSDVELKFLDRLFSDLDSKQTRKSFR